MATQILAAGTDAANSSDITAVAGTPVTIFLKTDQSAPVPSDADFDVKVKDAGGVYHTIGKLTGKNPVIVIDGPGTFRVSRVSASYATGVDQG